MLNRAPSVYTPIEPEDNGIVLPTVLSLLVHGAILTLIIFFHRAPKIDTPPPIETTIITPEELAALQSDIKANRAAAMADSSDNTIDKVSDASPDSVEGNVDNSSSSIASSISSIFTSKKNTIKPIELSEQPNPFDQEQEDIPLDDIPDLETNEEPTTKPNTDPKDPKKVDETFPPASGSPDKDTTNPLPGGGNNKSKGQIANELLNYISPKWNPDQKFVGTKITAYITVDDNGNVLTVTTNAHDKELGDSLIAAIKQASPLKPIAGSGYTKLEPVFVVNEK